MYLALSLFFIGIALIPTAILDMRLFYSKQTRRKVANIGVLSAITGLSIACADIFLGEDMLALASTGLALTVFGIALIIPISKFSEKTKKVLLLTVSGPIIIAGIILTLFAIGQHNGWW